jgi:hypothetical protein
MSIKAWQLSRYGIGLFKIFITRQNRAVSLSTAQGAQGTWKIMCMKRIPALLPHAPCLQLKPGTRAHLLCMHGGAGVGVPVSIQCGQFMIAMTGMGVYIGGM